MKKKNVILLAAAAVLLAAVLLLVKNADSGREPKASEPANPGTNATVPYETEAGAADPTGTEPAEEEWSGGFVPADDLLDQTKQEPDGGSETKPAETTPTEPRETTPPQTEPRETEPAPTETAPEEDAWGGGFAPV